MVISLVMEGFYFATAGEEVERERLVHAAETVYRIGGPGDLVFDVDFVRRGLDESVSRIYESPILRIGATGCKVISWSEEKFREMVSDRPELWQWICGQVTAKLMDEAVYSHISRLRNKRLACIELMIHLQRRWIRAEPDSDWQLPFKITEQRLASLLRCDSRTLRRGQTQASMWPIDFDYRDRLRVWSLTRLFAARTDIKSRPDEEELV